MILKQNRLLREEVSAENKKKSDKNTNKKVGKDGHEGGE